MRSVRPAAALALVLAAAGCPPSASETGPGTPPPDDGTAGRSPGAQMTGRADGHTGPPRPLLVFANQTLGWLEPCGCTEGMLGGLARRVAYLDALRARGFEPYLLDNGDLIDSPGRQSELKLETAYAILSRLGHRSLIVNRGERDIPMIGMDLRGTSVFSHSLTSCLPEPFPAIVPFDEGEAPLLVGVVALLAKSLTLDVEAGSSGSQSLRDPVAVLERARQNSNGFVGLLVLFHGPRDEARQLFADRTDVLAVVAGHDHEDPVEPERLPGGAVLVAPGNKGKYLALVELVRDGEKLRAEPLGNVPLDDRVPDDPATAALIEEYKRRLFEENLIAGMELKLPESGGRFLGPEACSPCHGPQYQVWKETKHTKAFVNLKPRNGTRDPECLRCHSTGFGFASGFQGVERTPHLAYVSCESCHGVGSNHMNNPQPGFGRVKEPAKLCVRCHDKENSPEFDFERYWPKIAHPRPKPPPEPPPQ